MSEMLAPGYLAANAVVTGAIMIVPANSPACAERLPARGNRDQALVLPDCLSRTKNPRSIQLSVMNSNVATETS